MLSLYIHIPFCQTKCKYCSFQVCPIDQMKSDMLDLEIQKYVDGVLSEISTYSEILQESEKIIKSIYFGGGTPQIIGIENIEKITDAIIDKFDTENIGEFSIEMNPYPQEEVFNIINRLNRKYKDFSRIRFSFGIQSFDNSVLSQSGRDISFPGLVEFFRNIQPLKKGNNIFNFDFIAFGKFNESKKGNLQLRNPNSLNFFEKLAESKFADSYSLYTLELFPGSLRYYQQQKKSGNGVVSCIKNKDDDSFGSDDDIYEEFSIIKDILLDRGYKRYEISSFSLLGKSSIHNRIYWEMENYIGFGTSAASFFKDPNTKLIKHLNLHKELSDNIQAVRRTNTVKISEYFAGNRLDLETIHSLSDSDLLIEEFFLLLRTDIGISDISKYSGVLITDYNEKIQSYKEQGFIEISKKGGIKLTDQGMDIYNDIITELLQEI